MDEKRIGLINLVRRDYGEIAKIGGSCSPSSCCGTDAPMPSLLETGRLLGYSDEDLRVGLGEANLGLGCGNPRAVAELKEGEVVLDLGSGAGFDAFLAAMKVGPKGKVIGVDMTPEMVARARQNAIALQTRNVEFRLGEIEHLPVADASVDVIISNCVINLSTDKQAVFKDCFRVLRPGGRIAISDILKCGEVPAEVMHNPSAYSGWISGAVPVGTMRQILENAGFTDICFIDKENSEEIIRGWNIARGVEKAVVSTYIKASKP